MRKPSSERVAEFQAYLGFFRAMWAFQEMLNPKLRSRSSLPDGSPYGESMATWALEAFANGTAPFTDLLTGTKQAVADQLEMTRDLPADAVKSADDFLVVAGAISLTEMRRRVWRVIPRVLARGRIRDIDEFYVVKNVLYDDGEDLSAGERTRLGKMRLEFELQAAPTRRRPAARERGARRSNKRRT